MSQLWKLAMDQVQECKRLLDLTEADSAFWLGYLISLAATEDDVKAEDVTAALELLGYSREAADHYLVGLMLVGEPD